MKQSAAVLAALGFGLLTYQNCSNVSFNNMQLKSTSVPPLCRDLSSPEVAPKLLWDWRAELANSPAPRFETFDQVMAAPAVADLDGDQIPEVAFITFSQQAADWFSDTVSTYPLHLRNGVLRVVDGRTGHTKFSVGNQALAPIGDRTPLLMDIDGDGKVEIFYLNYLSNTLIALNFDGSKRWTYMFPDGAIGMAATGFTGADMNRDGIGEIIAGSYIVSENSAHQPILQARLSTPTAAHYTPLALPLNPMYPGNWSIVNHLGIFNPDGTQKAAFAEPAYYLAAADVDPTNPGLEIIATGNEKLQILNGQTGAVIRSVDLAQYNDLKCAGRTTIGGGPATVGDFDGDPSTLEIAVATGRHLTIFDTQGVPKYKTETQDCSSLVTGLTSFDLNGDKKPEILYADEEYLRIFEIRKGKLEIAYKLANPSGTLYEYPVVADITGSGRAALLVVANNYPAASFYKDAGEAADGLIAANVTGVRAFTSAGESAWMPTRPIWNQYSFHPDLVTDGARFLTAPQLDGSIFRRNNQGYNLTLSCRTQ